ncbi:hypothetical protein RN001_003760 [Aquatica leii]|uniref:Mutator-like transposase domain-containing protein n=1 Tax=Aquatica leii TaxID=1421715 RepID=A0AAN7SMH1_9COLE|nr:hypothetical protein RN001_003760 [Aquatica leii]
MDGVVQPVRRGILLGEADHNEDDGDICSESVHDSDSEQDANEHDDDVENVEWYDDDNIPHYTGKDGTTQCSLTYNSEPSLTSDDDSSDEDVPLIKVVSKTTTSGQKLRISYVYSDEEDASTNNRCDQYELRPQNIKCGTHLLVELITKQARYTYAAVAQTDVEEDGENTKRHYRQVREEFTATGGGAKKVKPLLDYEERLLNLLSRSSVDGTDHLMEAGIPNSPQVAILEMEVPNEENYKVDGNVVSVEILPTSSIINIDENNFNCDNSLQAEVSTKGIQRQPKLRRQIRKCRVSRLDKSLQKFEEQLQNQIEVQNKLAISTDRLAAAIEAITGSISRGFWNMSLMSEKMQGLGSIFTLKCDVCGIRETIRSDIVRKENIGATNLLAVLGTISVGIGYSQLTVLLAAMDIPNMSNKTYINCYSLIGETNNTKNDTEMKQAGEQERRLNIDAGEVNKNGIPVISVIVHGAWSKRSYRTNYNALSSGVVTMEYRSRITKMVETALALTLMTDNSAAESKVIVDECQNNLNKITEKDPENLMVSSIKHNSIEVIESEVPQIEQQEMDLNEIKGVLPEEFTAMESQNETHQEAEVLESNQSDFQQDQLHDLQLPGPSQIRKRQHSDSENHPRL